MEQDLAGLRQEIEPGRPKPVPLPDNLPKEEILDRWSDELRGLIERLVVRHDEAVSTHTIEIVGDLAEMLAAAYPAVADLYRSESRSLKLIAGAGFGFDRTSGILRPRLRPA